MIFLQNTLIAAQTCLETRLGTGYTGSQDVPHPLQSHHCLPWSNLHPLRQNQVWFYKNKTMTSTSHLSDVSTQSCRNPDHDVNGPWCFVGDSVDVGHAVYCEISECGTHLQFL